MLYEGQWNNLGNIRWKDRKEILSLLNIPLHQPKVFQPREESVKELSMDTAGCD